MLLTSTEFVLLNNFVEGMLTRMFNCFIILVNKRNDTKTNLKYIAMLKPKHFFYYHLRQCLRDTQFILTKHHVPFSSALQINVINSWKEC